MCTRPRSHRGKRQHRFAHFTAPEERYTDEPLSARIRKCLVHSVSSSDDVCVAIAVSQGAVQKAGACAHSNAFLGSQIHVHTPSFSSRETPASLRPLHCPRGKANACFRVFATHKYDLFEKRRPPRFTGLACMFYYPRISPSQTTCRRSLCCDDEKNRSKNFKKPTAQAVLPPKRCNALLRVPKVANGSQSQQFGHHACTQCSQPFERWIVCEQRAK
jgi:hypothetical protein